MRSIELRTLHHVLQAPFERLRRGRAATDEQDRVVTRQRARDVRQSGAIDPLRQALGLTAIGPQYKKRVHTLEAAYERRDRAPQLLADGRAFDGGAGPRVGAVARALDQP